MERAGEESQLPRVLIAILSAGSSHLEASIVSALGQDYPGLEVLVVDIEGEGNVAEVASAQAVPVITSPKGRGLAAGANAVLYEPVDHCDWVVFCHDDAALEPQAVRLMIEGALEAGAAVVGPKVRDWQHPQVLREAGFGCDRYGYHRTQVDPGEADRGQHDLLKDVFFVSTTCMAVRLDVLAVLGGFDASLDSLEEDLDLCWRARLLGQKVIVVPSAVVYHDPSSLDLPGVKDPDAVAARNRMRIITKCYRPLRLLATLVSLLIQDAAEVGFRAVTGRPPRVMQKIALWGRYLLGLGPVLRSRSAVQKTRVTSDTDIQELQSRGSLRIRSALERQIHRESLEEGDELPQALHSAGSGVWEFLLHELTRPAVVFWIVWAIFVVVASRNILFARSAPIAGELGPFDPGLTTLKDYFASWHPDGVGYEGYASTAKLIAGVAQALAFGRSVGTLKIFLPLAYLFGGAGVWTIVRRISGATRWEGAAVATVLYSLSAPVVASYERGSISGIVTAATMPWAFALICRPILGRKGYLRCLALLVIATFVMASFEPVAPLLVVASGAGATVASVFGGRLLKALSALSMALLGGALGGALVIPWALVDGSAREVVSAMLRGWSGGRVQLGVGGVLRLQTTELGSAPLGYALAILAVAALLFCRGERLAWVGRTLFAAAIPAIGVWLAGQGVLPAVLESFPAVFCLGAVGFSVAAGLGVDGLRDRMADDAKTSALARLVVWPALVGVLAASGPGLIREVAGDLGIRRTVAEKSLEDPQAAAASGAVSVLWLGPEEVLPSNPRPLPGGAGGAYTVTGALPGPGLARSAPRPENFEEALQAVLSQMQSEGFTRGGKLLALLGIQYVAVPAPRDSYPIGSRPLPPSVVDGLSRQLDVTEVRGLRGIRLFRVGHESAVWTATAADPPVTQAATAPQDKTFRRWLEVELTGVAPVLDSVRVGETGEVDRSSFDAVILFKECDDGLGLTAAPQGATVSEIRPRQALGWACLFDLGGTAGSENPVEIELRHHRDPGFRSGLLLQLGGVGLVLLVAAAARSREEREYIPERLAALGAIEDLLPAADSGPTMDASGEVG